MSSNELLELGRSHVSDTPRDKYREKWPELVREIDRLLRMIDDGADYDPVAMRVFFTGVLSIGEQLLMEYPTDRLVLSSVENLRSRYEAMYFAMPASAANAILSEVFSGG